MLSRSSYFFSINSSVRNVNIIVSAPVKTQEERGCFWNNFSTLVRYQWCPFDPIKYLDYLPFKLLKEKCDPNDIIKAKL